MTDPHRRRGGVRLGVPLGVLLLAGVLVAVWAFSLRSDPTRVGSGHEVAAGEVAGDGSVEISPTPSVRGRVLTGNTVARFAAVWTATAARRRPGFVAPVVSRVATRTPEATDNILLALREAPDPTGRLWVRVRLAVRPNDTVGWVPREALGPYDAVRTRLAVDRQHLEATLYRAGKAVFRAPVGIGKPGTPTPSGHFYIRNRLTKYANAFYGPVAFGTSARAPTLTDWPAGGYVGIHGTDRPDLIPGRISHGCIRMRNQDILRLARLATPGTPLEIR